MDKEQYFSVKKGLKHTSIIDPNQFVCNRCKRQFDFSSFLPIDIEMLLGLAWGFSLRHSECETELERTSDE